jgi:hypothetical protein
MDINNVLGIEPKGIKETAATIFKLHSAKTEEYVSETGNTFIYYTLQRI